jgi:molybdopterin converting factor subunit 1
MRIDVHLFARARDVVGASQIAVELPAHATVADLRRRLAELHPGLARLLEHSAIAVNKDFADAAVPIPAGAEVALLPPVSGG